MCKKTKKKIITPKSYYFSVVKELWSTQKKIPVIDAIKKRNRRNKASSKATFDFSSLYKNILYNKLEILINFCFKGGKK